MQQPEAGWFFLGETHVCVEVEHLFGYDVVVSEEVAPDVWVPITIITRSYRMDAVEQRQAIRLVQGYDDVDWSRIGPALESLATEWPLE